MRILMINYEFPPIGGGTGNACYYMLKEFANYPDLQIDLVTFSPDNLTRTQSFSDNIAIHYVSCGLKASTHYWKTTELFRWLIHTRQFLKHHLQSHQYDLIHCWSGWPAGMLGYHFRKHAPYIIALRGSDIPGYSPRTRLLDALILRRLSRRIWSSAAAVTIVSRDAARLAAETLPHPFHVIHNGVSTTTFRPSPAPQTSTKLRLLYVGRLIPRKGVLDLVRAIQRLQSELPDPISSRLQLTIVGSGIQDQDIRAEIDKAGLSHSIQCLGVVPHTELPALYQSHDVFVLPSHSEAFSNAMQEAIASGLAILSTDTGGAELLDGNGLIIEARNPDHIKVQILQLLNDTQLLASMKQRSSELASSMSWRASADAYLDLYTKTINAGKQ